MWMSFKLISEIQIYKTMNMSYFDKTKKSYLVHVEAQKNRQATQS